MRNKEIWRDILEYEGLYQVSNLGRVKSLKRKYRKNENFIKTHKNKNGYISVILSKNNISKNFLVHRLVAQAFIPNFNNLLEINHKNENKSDNCVSNLEWCSRKYNVNYNNLNKRINRINRKDLSKQVCQYDLKGNFIKEWVSVMEIQRQLKYYNSAICECCNGKRRNAYGYIWKYSQ